MMILTLLLQTTNDSTEAFTRFQQTIGLVAVTLGSVGGSLLVVLRAYQDFKTHTKQIIKESKAFLASKDEIVAENRQISAAIIKATKENKKAIEHNTNITEQQAVTIQRHIIQRVEPDIKSLKRHNQELTQKVRDLEELIVKHLELTSQDDTAEITLLRALTEEGDKENPQVNDNLED